MVELDGNQVGHIDYLVNALPDRLYINKMEITAASQGKGIGIALLWHLWQIYQLPIVPLFAYKLSCGFWNRARRRFKGAGGQLLDWAVVLKWMRSPGAGSTWCQHRSSRFPFANTGSG